MALVESIKGFFDDPFNRYLAIALLLLGLFLFVSDTLNDADTNGDDRLQIHFFYSPTCPHCSAQKIFNAELAEEYPEIEIVGHDVTIPEELRYLQILAQNQSIPLSNLAVPTTAIDGYFFVGFDDSNETKNKLRNSIEDYIEGNVLEPDGAVVTPEDNLLEFDLPFIGKTDLSTLSLPFLAITLGLIDGFNPCAMWVLVYLIALLMNLSDRRRMILIAGTFVAASGILYFLFMTAWLNAFLFLGYVRVVTILIGLVALGGGILSVKEFVETKGALVCKVTGIEEKKKISDEIKAVISAPLSLATMAGIIVLAFTVNSVEFLCSAAIPTVFTQVLALSNLSFWEYYGYILLYDVFFMFDDALIFGLAAFTLSGVSGEKYSKYCKIIGGAILLILGLMLLFAPNMLV